MSEAERAEAILRREVDIGLLDKKWKVNALEIVMKNLVPIAACRELGLRAIDDPKVKKIVADYIGETNGEGHEHYGFNVWLLKECAGRAGGEHIFMRCLNCQKIRTSKRIDDGPCKCGGRRMTNMTGALNTRKALGYLASGY